MTIEIGYKRPSGRQPDELRDLVIETNPAKYAEGSALIRLGNTHVLCTASVEERVPGWMRNRNRGWVTAEYAMLPRATKERTAREAVQGKQGGRTVEIQRLIGRSLRAVTDLEALGERQVIVDCDVLTADAGTRCAAITGGYVALALAIRTLMANGKLSRNPLTAAVAGISVGMVAGVPVLDLDYAEDAIADVDCNIVMTDAHQFVEIQGTAEGKPFGTGALEDLLVLASLGVDHLFAAQREAIGRG